MLVHNIFEGIYRNFDLFPAKSSNFTISKVEWVEIIEISIISISSLVTLTRLILIGLLLIYFIKISKKIYQLVSCNQLKNTSIIEPISMDSPSNDKWGFT